MAEDRSGQVAVIFVSERLPDDDTGYVAAAEAMATLAATQPGYRGVDAVRGEDRIGITVSYWADDASAVAWRPATGDDGAGYGGCLRHPRATGPRQHLSGCSVTLTKANHARCHANRSDTCVTAADGLSRRGPAGSIPAEQLPYGGSSLCN